MKLRQFFKHLYIKATYSDNYEPEEKLDISNMSNALNIYERLICKLYNYYLENPEIYKNIKLYGKPIGLHKELIINNTRIIFSYHNSTRHIFSYEWTIEIEKLDKQALFPEYVNGELAVIMYSFDVRKEYSDFVNEFFTRLDDELFKYLV